MGFCAAPKGVDGGPSPTMTVFGRAAPVGAPLAMAAPVGAPPAMAALVGASLAMAPEGALGAYLWASPLLATAIS